MIEIDFKGEIDRQELTRAVSQRYPALANLIKIGRDENGRNYLRVKSDEITREALTRIIEDYLLKRPQMAVGMATQQNKEKERIMSGGGFTFGGIMEKEIMGVLQAKSDELTRQIDALIAKISSKEKQLDEVFVGFKAQAEQKISEIEGAVQATFDKHRQELNDCVAWRKRFEGAMGQAREKIQGALESFPAEQHGGPNK